MTTTNVLVPNRWARTIENIVFDLKSVHADGYEEGFEAGKEAGYEEGFTAGLDADHGGLPQLEEELLNVPDYPPVSDRDAATADGS